MHRVFIPVLFIIAGALSGIAQEPAPPTKVDRPVLNSYEPDAENPFGSLNPKARVETAQFEFMVGTFDCTDLIREPSSGKWYESKSVWT
ncbi:MAG: hypothetical protein OEQ28_02380, partial [Acidobacteriota bacterium]|nr:hypothetical protein [Acidobacteriota bacterium]